MQFPVLKCIMSFYLGLKYMHVCFNECMDISLSMGVYLCLCLLNKAIYDTRNENGGHT